MVTFLEAVLEGVSSSRDIKVATVFGSQARRMCEAGSPSDLATDRSDVDLQIATTASAKYRDPHWVTSLWSEPLRLYTCRSVIGAAKFTALYRHAELDLVVVPYRHLQLVRWLYKTGWFHRIGAARRALTEYADTLRLGQVTIKGGARWQEFNASVVKRLGRAALTDRHVVDAANVAFVDAYTLHKRLGQGELVAAMRLFHQSLIETNLRLLMEWRERRGLTAYHRGRRAEHIMSEDELSLIRFSPRLDREELQQAAIQCLSATRFLAETLTRAKLDWPE